MNSFPRRGLWLLLTLCLALWASPTFAATILVDSDCTLIDAIQSANLDSTISGSNCEAGNGADLIVLENDATYAFSEAFVMNDLGDISALPEITSTVTISGNGATVERAPALNTCEVLLLGPSNPAQFRLFEVGTTGKLTLYDIIIQNGCAASGGGIHNSGTLTVVDSTIRENTGMAFDDTIGGSGGIHNDYGEVMLLRSQLVSNTVLGGPVTFFVSCGGGVFNRNGTLSIVDSAIVGNHSEDANGGAGVCNWGGSVFISGSRIQSNTTSVRGDGGGIYSADDLDPELVEQAKLYISDSEILSNTTTGSGGGIEMWGTILTLKRSRVVANHADEDGGGLSTSYSSTVMIDYTQIVSNSTAQNGGGIFSRESNITVTHASILDNTAGNTGGAFYQALPREDEPDEIYPAGNAAITQSRIFGNSMVAVYSEGETVNAVDNWWGDPDGPSGEGDGDGDSVSTNVLFEPFKTEDFPINPPADFYQLLPYLARE